MQKRTIILLFFLAFFTLLFTACSQADQPEEAYWQYYQACSDGRFNDARERLTENAIETSRRLGVCAFTHDAINTVEAEKGNPPRTFSNDPTINAQENTSSLTWIDDQGNIASVVLILVDGEWKVADATWSY